MSTKKVTHMNVQSSLWSIAKNATVGTHTIKGTDGKVTTAKNKLTSKKLVSLTDQFKTTESVAGDALEYAKGKLAVDSNYSLNDDVFDTAFAKPDRDGKVVPVDMNNSGYTVKVYSNNIREGASLLKTHGSKLASALRFGINKSQSDKIKGLIHSVLQDNKSPLRLSSSRQFKVSLNKELNPDYCLDQMLEKIADNLEMSELDTEMVVQDISIGKRHKAKGGCNITQQTLGEWIVELHELAQEAKASFSAEQSKLNKSSNK